jgi:hypothetical protein
MTSLIASLLEDLYGNLADFDLRVVELGDQKANSPVALDRLLLRIITPWCRFCCILMQKLGRVYPDVLGISHQGDRCFFADRAYLGACGQSLRQHHSEVTFPVIN